MHAGSILLGSCIFTFLCALVLPQNSSLRLSKCLLFIHSESLCPQLLKLDYSVWHGRSLSIVCISVTSYVYLLDYHGNMIVYFVEPQLVV